MKTNNFNFFGTLKSFALIATISIATISCNNEELDGMNDTNSSSVALENNFSSVSRSTKAAPAPGTQSIAAIAIDAKFTELVGALVYVDGKLGTKLVDMFLNGKDQYTVFAPTNDAFKNLYTTLGVGGITELDATLVLNVLQYHVVEGRRAANSVVPMSGSRQITTLLGAGFSVDKKGMITAVGNTATITTANISASNGIIHVVDSVLLPIKIK